MKIHYLSISYVPSRRASSIHVMKMCQALAGLGNEVTLITKRCEARQEANVQNDYAFYGVDANFDIVKLARPQFRGGGLLYNWAQWHWLYRNKPNIDLVYSRDILGAWLAAKQGSPVIFEAHGLPTDRHSYRLHERLFSSLALQQLVVISQALQEAFAQRQVLPPMDRITIAHDGANPQPFLSAAIANADKHAGPCTIGYMGHLYAGRGIDLIIALAERIETATFEIIGGTESDIQYWRNATTVENLAFLGFLPPAALPEYMSKMDILLMPYQKHVQVAGGRTDTSRWMSPMKMFEYMAAGKAIVSSDLPVLREVLTHERNALLVPPDDVDAWDTAVRRLIADPDLRQQLGQTARQDLCENYTWQARAKKVLACLDEH